MSHLKLSAFEFGKTVFLPQMISPNITNERLKEKMIHLKTPSSLSAGVSRFRGRRVTDPHFVIDIDHITGYVILTAGRLLGDEECRCSSQAQDQGGYAEAKM